MLKTIVAFWPLLCLGTEVGSMSKKTLSLPSVNELVKRVERVDAHIPSTMSNLVKRVEMLEARVEIQDLLGRYSRLLDKARTNPDDFMPEMMQFFDDNFHPEATYTVGDNIFQGIEEIKSGIRESLMGYNNARRVTDIQILDVDADHNGASVQMAAHVSGTTEDGENFFLQSMQIVTLKRKHSLMLFEDSDDTLAGTNPFIVSAFLCINPH